MRLITLLCMLVTLAVPVQVQADPVEALTRKLSKIDTLAATFTQQVKSADGSVIQVVTGELEARRPGRFRWHTFPPLEQVVVTDGTFVWFYDPDLEQVTVQPLSGEAANTPALLFSGDTAEISQRYTVRQQGESVFILAPRDQSDLFVELALRFDGDKPVEMEILDALGQRSRLDLKNIRINPDIPSERFTFEVPEGVDIIRGDGLGDS